MEAESRLHVVERERDIYRLLALRWQRRLQAAMNERGENNEGAAGADDEHLFAGIDDVAAAAIFAGDEAGLPLVIRLGGLGAMIRRFQHDSDDEDEEETDGGDENNGQVDMDGDSDMSEDGDAMEASEAEPMAVSPEAIESSPMNVRPQVRTVSITSHDL